ncbi:hypothetical protein [Erythrobacter rubeus]|uniref:Uncharacterized protein n=1 Tax=Erythrobacter rubeus TaxID=2760803 RepID=A0ABR8KY66_9SPHN|nr:hypothetical protein [Erythrobacter rubeus]MBD2843106.1 hypothetical protein [Erythrobacter rubeus]
MTLFSPDLYRNFAIGFVAGTLMVGAASFDHISDLISPPAQAAQTFEAPQPSDDFWVIEE